MELCSTMIKAKEALRESGVVVVSHVVFSSRRLER
jgi:hypothetical protein